MLNKFFNSLTYNDTKTENGMATHSTSGSYLVDLFYKMGGYRQIQDKTELVKLFNSAFNENNLLAVRALFHLRNIRGGMGERESFRWILRNLALQNPVLVENLLEFVPFYGRFDDLLVLIGTKVEEKMADFLLFSLKNKNQLCAKWMPRENKSLGNLAKVLMKYWNLNPKEYRLLLSGNTSVVESLMCKNKWGEINYQHVPSVAMKNYRKAFSKHDPDRFVEYLEKVKKGEAKINTSTLSPVDIVHEYFKSYKYEETLEQLWNNLPDTVPNWLSFLPICDVSGSMSGVPMEVSVSLGIYLSQRNKSIFKDGFITFSAQPKLQILKGKTLRDKMDELSHAKWDMNTNIQAVFELILDSAVRSKLSQEDLPKYLLIISDMQFDQCIEIKRRFNWRQNKPEPDVEFWNLNIQEMIDKKFKDAGYKRPNIIYWNVRTSEGIPVKMDENGTGLVSGYSPNILKYLLKGELNPLKLVEDTLNSETYSIISF